MDEDLSPAERFYKECIELLKEGEVPFLVGGSHAVISHTGIERDIKDIDIFCKAGDYPKIINFFVDRGYDTKIEDERWIAKVLKGEYYLDIIFNSANASVPVSDEWLDESDTAEVYGVEVRILSPTELFWSKAFVADRYKYDGPDIAHLILKRSQEINWDRLIKYFEQYWEVLLLHIINFRFIYPSERELIPRNVLDELLERLAEQLKLPTAQTRVCRGRLFSRGDYQIDVSKWGFADLIGDQHEPGEK